MTATPAAVVVSEARSAAAWAEAEALIRAYLHELPFEIDFQDVDRELAELAVEYGPPEGAGLLARRTGPGTEGGEGAEGDEGSIAVGFVGVRRFGAAGDGDAELKRMFVTPAARGTGAGRALAAAAVDAARRLGYRRLLLDTVAWMTTAIAIYEDLGFEPTAPYRHNPLPDARFYALPLTAR